MGTEGESTDRDYIDEVVAEWAKEAPDWDTDGLQIGGRVFAIHRHLERRIDRYLAQHNLQIWGFDVLASLLRSGPPYTQTPTQLMRNCFLTSGAVTNRLHRLEQRGWISRHQSDEDKRSFGVTLTGEGLHLARKAVQGRIEFMKPVFDIFDEAEHADFTRLLRKLTVHLEKLEGWS